MPFEPLHTERLLIRSMTPEDGENLWERRNDPDVARYQNWPTPYPRERCDEIARSSSQMDGPAPGWWMASVEKDGEVIGDLAVHLNAGGEVAEIGYTFLPAHWGRGYAIEAARRLVEHLFDDLDVQRVFGMLHPANPSSARVLERLGMVFEGHTRLSFWLDGEGSDDWIYGMTRDMWEAWRDRPRATPATVELVGVTPDNVLEVLALRTHKTQESFVAPMAKSLAQAAHPRPPTRAWYRAMAADGEIVGFVMLGISDVVFLWRLLVDRMHQRRGIASIAMDLVEQEVRTMGHEALFTSWVPGRGSPEPFYLGRGFELTGGRMGDEVAAQKRL